MPAPAVDRLTVYLHDHLAGRVERLRDDSLVFTYAPDYRGRLPLSPRIPVGDRTFRDDDVRPYLEGLLPDNEDVRLRWAREFETTDDPFHLLAHMGLDCPGAVRFTREGDEAMLEERPDNYVPLTDADIGRRLRELVRTPSAAGWTMPDEHWSLPGAQGKITLARIEGGWHEADGGAPSTHILKPGIATMSDQAATEYATMRVASLLGLRTASVELAEFDGEQAIVVERYDRLRTGDGGIRRLHQVDLCQAMGVPPRKKYERDGGPTAPQLARMLRLTSTSPDLDVRRFSDALLFNYVTGSPDGHAKNFALLYAGRQVRFAPLYDLATGLPYDKKTAPPYSAFSIGGVRNFGEAYEKTWRRHAEDLGLDPDERVATVRSMLEQVPDAFRRVLLTELPEDQGPTLWRRLTEHPGRLVKQTDHLLDRLSPAPPDPVGAGVSSPDLDLAVAVNELRTVLGRGERPLVPLDRLGHEVDRLRGLVGSMDISGPDEIAGPRRAELLREARTGAALVMALASDGTDRTWVRRLQQLGEPGPRAYGTTVLVSQRILPALAWLASAGLAATAAENWELVDHLLTEVPVTSGSDRLEPLAECADLVQACSGTVVAHPGGFLHPLGLLAAYAGDVARATGQLSRTDVETAWDRWEYLWLARRRLRDRTSGVPHLQVATSDRGGYAPVVRPWAWRPDARRDEWLSWLPDAREDVDAWLVGEALEQADSARGKSLLMPSGTWRVDSIGARRIPSREVASWSAFLVTTT